MKTLEKSYKHLNTLEKAMAIYNDAAVLSNNSFTKSRIFADIGHADKEQLLLIAKFLEINLKRRLEDIDIVNGKLYVQMHSRRKQQYAKKLYNITRKRH